MALINSAIKKIIFINNNNRGDVHVNRGFLRPIINKVISIYPDSKFYYSHRHCSDLLSDVPNLEYYQPGLLEVFSYTKDINFEYHIMNDTVYINTWYNCRHTAACGISFDNLYASFDSICKALWGFSLKEISLNAADFYPIIDYSAFYISEAQKWLSINANKKIFVSNNLTLSGQSNNYLMAPIIIEVARNNKDKIFILSNEAPNLALPSNVIYSSDIIKKPIPYDLNENSFISSHCDVIIGRSSGAFTFAVTRDNLFNRKIKIICPYNLLHYNDAGSFPVPFWTAGKYSLSGLKYSATIIERNALTKLMMISLIESNL